MIYLTSEVKFEKVAFNQSLQCLTLSLYSYRSLEDKKARKCPHCDKTYVSMPAFSMHLRTHNQGCKCPHCGKCFSRPWLLQGHIKTHTGEKKHEQLRNNDQYAGVISGFVLFKWRTPEQYKRTKTPKNMFNKGQILLIFWYFVDKHHYILSDHFVLSVKKQEFIHIWNYFVLHFQEFDLITNDHTYIQFL